ncbi:MAG: sporulation protein YabP [Oscillospiraceae bacterium]|nr:sporulation protein YabP [Oscillospiraceae bacterium]
METAHSAILENRERLQLSGVTAIGSFDDRTVILYTQCGQLTVIGRELQMRQLSVESGAVIVEGEVQALRYSDRDRTEPLGFFGRLLR